jgi:hypothetical protein
MSFSILPRTAWTSAAPGGAAISKTKVVGIAAHYPGDGNVTYAALSQAQAAAKFVAYRNYHVNTRGWLDIGYNYGVDQAGRVWVLRGDRVGGHAAPYNSTYLGVLLLIGNTETPTTACVASFWALVAHLKANGFPNIANIVGHGELKGLTAPTACPGKVAMPVIRAQTGSPPTPPPAPKPGATAPVFPLPKGHAFGPKSGPAWQHSGYFDHRADLKVWQQRMIDRGWNLGKAGADGLYGPDTARVARQFQAEKGLKPVDALIGAVTWAAAWTAPIT